MCFVSVVLKSVLESTPLKIKHGTPKWRFGRWLSLSTGQFFRFHVKFQGSQCHFESQECDAILLRHGVEEFLTYDLVGAPWSWAYKKATNLEATAGGYEDGRFHSQVYLSSIVSFFMLVSFISNFAAKPNYFRWFHYVFHFVFGCKKSRTPDVFFSLLCCFSAFMDFWLLKKVGKEIAAVGNGGLSLRPVMMQIDSPSTWTDQIL